MLICLHYRYSHKRVDNSLVLRSEPECDRFLCPQPCSRWQGKKTCPLPAWRGVSNKQDNSHFRNFLTDRQHCADFLCPSEKDTQQWPKALKESVWKIQNKTNRICLLPIQKHSRDCLKKKQQNQFHTTEKNHELLVPSNSQFIFIKDLSTVPGICV